VRICLVTASALPKPDVESPELARALRTLGVDAQLAAWDDVTFEWAACDLVVIRSPWDYFWRLDEFLRWDLSWVTALGTEVVAKPAVSIGAIGALRGASNAVETAQQIRVLARSGDLLVQPFISSVLESGEASLVFFGDTFSHAIRKIPARGEYRVQDHHGGWVVSYEPTAADIDVARAALRAAPAECAYARVDLVQTDNGPVVMELELVEPALFLEEATGAVDRFARHLAAL
jgi:RimK-like ATP-grasp domain